MKTTAKERKPPRTGRQRRWATGDMNDAKCGPTDIRREIKEKKDNKKTAAKINDSEREADSIGRATGERHI